MAEAAFGFCTATGSGSSGPSRLSMMSRDRLLQLAFAIRLPSRSAPKPREESRETGQPSGVTVVFRLTLPFSTYMTATGLLGTWLPFLKAMLPVTAS